MPLDDFDFDLGEDENGRAYSWEYDVEHIYVVRDGEEWTITLELEDGEEIELDYPFSDEEAQHYIWDELYYWALEYDIDIDKEVDYGED